MVSIISTVNRADLSAFRWCMSRKHIARIARVSRVVSALGDGYLYVLIALCLWWMDTVHSVAMLQGCLLAFVLELPSYLVFKNAIRRQRPADVIVGFDAFLLPSDTFSFPSGHTAAAFLMATNCAIYFPSFLFVAFFVATAVGVSRVLLGVHFPSDIVAGAILGMASALMANSILGV